MIQTPCWCGASIVEVTRGEAMSGYTRPCNDSFCVGLDHINRAAAADATHHPARDREQNAHTSRA